MKLGVEMFAEVKWYTLGSRSRGWRWTRCLYAYLHPDDNKILYIGKADGPTVRKRFNAPDKDDLFDFLKDEMGITSVVVIAGWIELEAGRRLSRELLADIESLLIRRLRPVGNVQSTRSRVSRSGLTVLCLGAWPCRRARFVDR